jgi:hypothetical protein
MKPFIWMDDLGTWFTNETYQTLDDDLKDGLFPLYTTPQTKPLNWDEVDALGDELLTVERDAVGLWAVMGIRKFARAIQERHGIK